MLNVSILGASGYVGGELMRLMAAHPAMQVATAFGATAAGQPTDFNSLSAYMPAETRNYVPKLQAVKNIIATPAAYGIVLPKVDNQPYLATAIWATSAVETMPPSINCAGAGACTTALSQARHAYLGRIVRKTRSMAGTRSSASLTSSPMRCNFPLQQGHSVVAGSITRSQRGRCSGSFPMLRSAFLRGVFLAGSPGGTSSFPAAVFRVSSA